MGLLAKNGKIAAGEVLIEGKDLTKISDKEIRDLRWKDISIVFQNSMTALNPVRKVGDQIVDALQRHEKVSREDAIQRGKLIFDRVGIAKERFMQYPHEFSGGMKQRAVLALALICHPKIMLADEPTTALDVVAQRQVLNLFRDLQEEFGLSLLMISHDISAVAEICEEIAVMYAGRIMEVGETKQVLHDPDHPYTYALVNSFPSLHKPLTHLEQIPGSPPFLAQISPGCPFAPRCPFSEDLCSRECPPLMPAKGGKLCRCHFTNHLDFSRDG